MTLPRVLIAWELGSNYGHAAKIVEIVKSLIGRAELIVVAENPAAVRRFAPDIPLRIIQAPSVDGNRRRAAPGWNYADNLRQFGYDNAEALLAVISDWLSIFNAEKPDLVMAQCAPTALLAARGLSFTTVNIGNGFEIPPAITPMPTFFHWTDRHADIAASGEATVCDTINTALAKLGGQPVESVLALLDADETILTTIPELDHYGTSMRGTITERYAGSIYTRGAGTPLNWAGTGRRIFAYLRSDCPGTLETIEALGAMAQDDDVILVSPGLPHPIASRFCHRGGQFLGEPANLAAILPACQLGISHASIGVVSAFAYGGIPQIGLPSQVEQTMLARVMGEAGLGVGLVGEASPSNVRHVIEACFGAKKIADASSALAERYAGSSTERVVEKIAGRIVELLN